MNARARLQCGEHGTYTRYSSGCREACCRKAKAEYMRARRSAAREMVRLNPARVVVGVKHGTAYAYDERGCRCGPCVAFATAWKNGASAARAAA